MATEDLEKRRLTGELRRLREVVQDQLDAYIDNYQSYVRLYRALHGHDPDPIKVPPLPR